jgi:prevent-host-death family protein
MPNVSTSMSSASYRRCGPRKVERVKSSANGLTYFGQSRTDRVGDRESDHEATRTAAAQAVVIESPPAVAARTQRPEAKALFSQLVDEAARGARFVIAKAGTPVARIVPFQVEPAKFVFGTMRGLLSPEDELALVEAIATARTEVQTWPAP